MAKKITDEYFLSGKREIAKNIKFKHKKRKPGRLDDTESSGGLDKALNDGMDKDLIDGKYIKILYVKTLNGNTISIKYDPLDTVDSTREQIERKTRIQKEQQHFLSRGKSPEGQVENRRLQHERRRNN